MKYFAYGSNMYTKRLRSRVPSCRFCRVASLSGYTIKFHKRSTDDSGKCNAYRTDSATDELIGVVFEIADSEKPELDRAEGLGAGYHEETVTIAGTEGMVDAYMYVADDNAIDDSLEPYTWYKDLVVAGAKEHRLPQRYIEELEAVPAKQDPDGKRERQNRALVM